MSNLHYTNKTIKMHPKTWELFKLERKKSGLSWNLYILKLLGVKNKLQRKKLYEHNEQTIVETSSLTRS